MKYAKIWTLLSSMMNLSVHDFAVSATVDSIRAVNACSFEGSSLIKTFQPANWNS